MASSEPNHHSHAQTQNHAAIEREQNFISLAQCSEAFRYHIQVVVGVLPLKMHPMSLFTFMLATLIYYLAFEAYSKLNIQVFGVIAFISGLLSLAIIVYIHVPLFIGCIVIISWTFVSIFVVHQHIPLTKETYERIRQKIKNSKILEKASNFWYGNEPGLPKDRGDGEQESIISSSLKQCNGAFIFLIPVLVTVVQVCVQGTTKSPSETHPANLYAFLLATIIFIFSFAFTAADTNFSQSQLSSLIAFITGSLSSVSLVSIIVPHWIAYTIFILWALVSSCLVYHHATLTKETYNWFLREIQETWLCKKIREKISSLWKGQILPY